MDQIFEEFNKFCKIFQTCIYGYFIFIERLKQADTSSFRNFYIHFQRCGLMDKGGGILGNEAQQSGGFLVRYPTRS